LSSVQIESQNSITDMSASHSSFISEEDRAINYNNELIIQDTHKDTTEQIPFESNLKPRLKSALCKKESSKNGSNSEV
jgi:hypothetical protein